MSIPVVPPLLFGPIIAVLFALGQEGTPALPVIGWIIGGYAFWTLTEYWLHRVVFHFEPEDGIGARLHWIIHGVHHDHPNDPMRLVMPPSVSLPLAGNLLRAVLVRARRPRGLPIRRRLPRGLPQPTT